MAKFAPSRLVFGLFKGFKVDSFIFIEQMFVQIKEKLEASCDLS
jgi:hypothetical protein